VTYDIAAVRAQFPALKAGRAHFDGPGGTQTPLPVIEAVADALAGPLSNRGTVTTGERNAEAAVTGARQAVADLLGADPSGVVFGRSATQLAYDFSRTLAKTWYEDGLRQRIEQGLAGLRQITVHSRAAHRTPTLLLTIEGRSSVDAYRFLADRGVDAPSGSFYAVEASRRLGLGDGGGLRVGLAPYNDVADVDRLLEGLADFLAGPV
jgi:selenocysteine lyase/cysteine desulfurase